jgi:hypothetical protein
MKGRLRSFMIFMQRWVMLPCASVYLLTELALASAWRRRCP